MQLVSDFLEKFKDGLKSQNNATLAALSMTDDVTGWSVSEFGDDHTVSPFNQGSKHRNEGIESQAIELEPLDVFGNGESVVVVCRYQCMSVQGGRQKVGDDEFRLSLYLVEHKGLLKIRHWHISKAWPEGQPFSDTVVSACFPQGEPVTPVRLNSAENGPFVEWLNKLVAYTGAANLDGMLGLQHQNNSNVYWQLQGRAFRGKKQYREHLLYLKERYHEPVLKYSQLVVFRNQSLVCLSTCGAATYIDKQAHHTISPLRATYILQETEGRWLCRHSHCSLPVPAEVD